MGVVFLSPEYEKIWRDTDGVKTARILRLRMFLEKLDDDDLESLPEIISSEDVVKLIDGEYGFLVKRILTKAPKILPLAKSFCRGLKMLDEEKIKREGVTLLEEFSRGLSKVPETEETHYVMDLKNILREDAAPIKKGEYPSKFLKLAPRTEEDYVVVEKGV